jgi:hypothetical protein
MTFLVIPATPIFKVIQSSPLSVILSATGSEKTQDTSGKKRLQDDRIGHSQRPTYSVILSPPLLR